MQGGVSAMLNPKLNRGGGSIVAHSKWWKQRERRVVKSMVRENP